MVPFNSLLVIYMPRDDYFTSKIDQKYINLDMSPAGKINLGDRVGLTWKTVRTSKKIFSYGPGTYLTMNWFQLVFLWSQVIGLLREFFVGHR